MKFYRWASPVFLALAIAVAGCGSSSDSTGSAPESSAPTEAASAESTSSSESTESTEPSPTSDKTRPKVTVPKGISPNEFSFKELEEGTGPSAKSGDTVTIQYAVAGYDSKREVDSSWSRNEPYTFTLGSGEALKGGERGVEGMKAGGRRELIIPGRLGYGPKGYPPSIAPNETLIFVVDLLAIK